jgi:dihydropteroate synthase
MRAAGLDADQVALDPGIGFGKTLVQNLDLLARLAELRTRARPLLLGISRKSFIGMLLGLEPHERGAAGLACTVWAAGEGVQIFRTHEVAPTVQALRMREALAQRKPGTA